jgi:SAM-dependent methyltransferase
VRPRLARSEGRHLFGHDPETYDRVRPGHPDAVYKILRKRCGLGTGSKVLEIGPGTGQASRRLPDFGAEPLIGVEPDPRLARFLRDSIGHRVEVLESTLEDAGLDADFDLAAAASSFHWVEEALGLAKLRNALRPGGWIALWWTSFGERDTAPSVLAGDRISVRVDHPDRQVGA